MKVKEFIELLKQSDPETEIAIEYCDIDDFCSCYGTEYARINSDDCKSKDGLFVINIEDYQHT